MPGGLSACNGTAGCADLMAAFGFCNAFYRLKREKTSSDESADASRSGCAPAGALLKKMLFSAILSAMRGVTCCSNSSILDRSCSKNYMTEVFAVTARNAP